MNRSVVVLSLFLSVAASGQDLSTFEKLLLPAYAGTPIQGGYGSTFSTVLECYTEVDTVVYAGVPGAGGPASFVVQPAMNPICIALGYGPARATGRFLYVEPGGSDRLALQYFLLSSDAAGTATDQMTALPIVATPFSGPAMILGIPVRPVIVYQGEDPRGYLAGYQSRIRLRVYDWGGDGTNRVTVRPYVENLSGDQGALGSILLPLDQRDGDDPTFPWYGELPLEWCVPFSAHTPCMSVNVRLSVSADEDDVAFWPFVTVTDNRTQHVTVFAPQP